MLDSPESVCAGQAWFEYPALSFSLVSALLMFSYQGESWVLDSPERVCAGQMRFEYPATSVLFSKCSHGVQVSALL